MSNENKNAKPDTLTRTDLASDIMGKNSLQGDDQASVRNQRHAQAEAKLETDGVIESFEKLDKDVRAEKDLGKGNRSGAGSKDEGDSNR